ncbi:MAG: phosphate acyltransferase PlsX [Myxococcota bacterium]
MIRVALDAMGGDHGLACAVEGAARLSLEPVDIEIVLAGDQPSVEAALKRHRHDPSRLRIVHAEGCVAMDAKPGEALAEQPNCSILTAARLVAEGEADALVSAGNTGATILAAARTFERLPGVRRAALAAVYPTAKTHGPHRDPFALMLDVGATLKAAPEDLVAFAVMGAAYSSIVSQIDEPRVALLSNGTEATKGTKSIVTAHDLLEQSQLRFTGNVEGLDIPRGSVDVVVCDGFLGNVVLKMLEGVSDVVKDLMTLAARRRWQWRLGLALLRGRLQELRRLTDWKAYGGAPLLGLDQVVIKAHGRSEALALRNAIKVAAKAVRGDLIGKIRHGIAELGLGDPAGDSAIG